MSTVNTGFISKEEADRLQQEARTVYIHSKLGFLNAHNGLRPGCIHTLMGMSHAGKSTMVRTLVRDFAFNPENSKKKLKMHIRLSEESVEEFRRELSYGVPESERMLDITISSEMEDGLNQAGLHELIASVQPDVLIYDNITTSRYYSSKRPGEQAQWCAWMKKISKDLKTATILVAHTGTEITESLSRLINMNDLRGAKDLVNLSEFFYVFQRFEMKDSYYPILWVSKHRGQELINKYYYLDYAPAVRSFVRDQAITFDQVKSNYAKRNRL